MPNLVPVYLLLFGTLAIAIFALTESQNLYDNVSEGYIPLKQNGRFVNSVLNEDLALLNSGKTIQVPDQSVLVGGVRLSNGGTSVVSTASGRNIQQYFVVSELEAAGSTTAFQWKFGPLQDFPPLVAPNIVELSDESGVLDFSVNVQGNNLFTRFSYTADREVPQVNLQVFIADGDTPIYDYFRSTQQYFAIGTSETSIELGSPVFFEQGLLLRTVITNQAGTQFGLLGDDFGNTGFLISSANTRRAAEKITFTDTETTVGSALTQFDIYVKATADPTVATGSTLFPYADIQTAIDNATNGDSIFVDGPFTITTPVNVNKGVSIVGTQGNSSLIQYATFDPSNGAVFNVTGGSFTVNLINLEFANGQYGVLVDGIGVFQAENVTFTNNGWNGEVLSLTLPESSLPSGGVGYDSSEANKLAFGASNNINATSAGLRVANMSTGVIVEGCTFQSNYNGLEADTCTGTGLTIRDSLFFSTVETSIMFKDSQVMGLRNVSILAGGNAVLDIDTCYDVTAFDLFVRGSWAESIKTSNSGNVRIAGLNSDDSNRTLFSPTGTAVSAYAVLIAGTTLPASATFVAVMTNATIFAGAISVAHERGGVCLDQLAQIDDIENASVNLENCVYKNLDNCITFEDGSITNSTSGERATRVILTGNTFNNAVVTSILNLDGGDFYELPFNSQATNLPDVLDCAIDDTSTSITLTPGNVYNVNQLFAYTDNSTYITIIEINTNRIQLDLIPPDKVTINGSFPGDQSINNVVNEMNALFTQTGSSSGNPPVLTSPDSVNTTQNVSIVYDLTANNLGGLYWTSMPTGLAPTLADTRRLEGVLTTIGSFQAVGTMSNAFGATVATITFNVSAGFVNSKSTYFRRVVGQVQGTVPVPTSFPMYRLDNDTGAAWSISLWFYNNNRNNTMTLFEYAIGSNNSRNRVNVFTIGSSGDFGVLYGDNSDYIDVQVEGETGKNAWYHVVVTYDGGTTGDTPGSVTDYYSRFQIFINDTKYVQGHPKFSGSNGNSGFTGGFAGAAQIRFGRSNGNPTQGFDGWVDEVSMYTRVLSDADVTTIYNGGDAGIDLVGSGLTPTHWWQMGDGSVYPASDDNAGSFDLTLINKLSSDIQNFVAT